MNKLSNKFKETIEIYEKLGRDYVRNIQGAKVPHLSRFIKMLPKGSRVLDIGCAGGRDSLKFANSGFEVIGIDLVDIFLKECRKNIPKAKFIKMDVRKLEFPKNYFDGIWTLGVLIHIDRKGILKTLKEMYRVLKPGGKIFIAVKKGRGEKFKKEKITAGKGRLTVYFTKNEMEKLIKQAGFKILSSEINSDFIIERKYTKWINIIAEKNKD